MSSKPDDKAPAAATGAAEEGAKEKKARVAPHIDAPAFDRRRTAEEIERLAVWVEGYLVPVWVHSPSGSAPWCARWREHPDAVSTLHALWLSWQVLIDTAGPSGSTGPAVWMVQYLHPLMERLRGPHGPFAGCIRDPGSTKHQLPPPLGGAH